VEKYVDNLYLLDFFNVQKFFGRVRKKFRKRYIFLVIARFFKKSNLYKNINSFYFFVKKFHLFLSVFNIKGKTIFRFGAFLNI